MVDRNKDVLRLTIGQLNPTVGDIDGNYAKIITAREQAKDEQSDLLVLPEFFLAGFPTEDLVFKHAFVAACRRKLEQLAKQTANDGPAILVGAPWYEKDKLYNGIFLLDEGKIKSKRFKVELPNYGVFDDKRLFEPGNPQGPIEFRGIRIGVPICEDIWFEEVAECLLESGAEILIVPNASPYCEHKMEPRLQVIVKRVVETGLPIVYVNQMGAQDELVFDGGSFALNPDRKLSMQLPQFEECVSTMEWKRDDNDRFFCSNGEMHELPKLLEANWRACVFGLQEYVTKNGFPGVILGLSGGIDSAVCAAMSVDALGADKVKCFMMPYKYTSQDSLDDAAACAKILGVNCESVPIEAAVDGLTATLSEIFKDTKPDITEENLQSRIRGTILMSVSNKFGPLVITTGNKSEYSVGYATLYGDMNGGFNPIKDIFKTDLYKLAEWRNQNHPKEALGPSGEVIPTSIINKIPSAELREGQTDQDSLPPYDILDDILKCLIDNEMSVDEIAKKGHDRTTIRDVENLLYTSEFKRRQAAPGVRISEKSFGRDRRYPITNKFRDSS